MSDNTNKYTQLDTENYIQYAKRLINGRNDGVYDLEKSEVYELLTGESVSGDHARKMLCFLEKIINKVEEQNINMSENELLDALTTKKQELYKERQKLRDEKNTLNMYLREQARVELFYERIDEAAEKIINKKRNSVPNVDNVVRAKDLIDNNDTELVVSFADAHYDAEFIIKGLNGETLNEYNKDIFEKRMWKLRDEIVDFAGLHNISKLKIIDLGDVIDGIIRVASLQSVKNSPMDSILDYTDFIETWLNQLIKECFHIDFYTSLGNHSTLRILNGEIHENLECIYNRLLRKMFKDEPDITIHNNINGINYFSVQGYNFLSVHGQNEKNISNSINEYQDTYNVKINYMLVGHKHSKRELETSGGKEVIQVRSIMGINDFSTTIKKSSNAGATMFTVHKDYGKKYVNDVKFQY